MSFDNNKLLVEFLGSFFFISIILHSIEDKSIGSTGIAIALLATIYFGGTISGAHYNPAVTVAMMVENKVTVALGILFIISQVSGALAAVKFNQFVLKNQSAVL
jgi:aquaporin Z